MRPNEAGNEKMENTDVKPTEYKIYTQVNLFIFTIFTFVLFILMKKLLFLGSYGCF